MIHAFQGILGVRRETEERVIFQKIFKRRKLRKSNNWNFSWRLFFLFMKMKVSVAQLYLTLCDPMDCSPPGSSVHGISQARILEWVAMPFSRGSFPPRSPTFQADSLPFEPLIIVYNFPNIHNTRFRFGTPHRKCLLIFLQNFICSI